MILKQNKIFYKKKYTFSQLDTVYMNNILLFFTFIFSDSLIYTSNFDNNVEYIKVINFLNTYPINGKKEIICKRDNYSVNEEVLNRIFKDYLHLDKDNINVQKISSEVFDLYSKENSIKNISLFNKFKEDGDYNDVFTMEFYRYILDEYDIEAITKNLLRCLERFGIYKNTDKQYNDNTLKQFESKYIRNLLIKLKINILQKDNKIIII